MLHEIFKYRDLLYMLTLRDIRIRYKQAAMGFIWAVFMPIIAVAAGVVIKIAMAEVSRTEIELLGIVSISVKVVPWTFFSSAIRFSVQSLIGNSSLVTKIYFPKAVLPLAGCLACLFDFLIAISVVVVMLIIAQLGVSIHLLWIPLVLLSLFLFAAGLGLLLSAANLFFRDVKYIVEAILTFGIFFTPILYSAKDLGQFEILILLNPISSIFESINQIVVLKQAPDPLWFSYAVLCSFLMFLFGLRTFQRKEPLFAENI